ncbi:hypothetical protein RB195_020826 [Necator americanus]|uniref:Uncharacterized protein n=1 Tax=Necator americanus TaxID=51031 RepID=A0ABR1CLJ8_NECAM
MRESPASWSTSNSQRSVRRYKDLGTEDDESGRGRPRAISERRFEYLFAIVMEHPVEPYGFGQHYENMMTILVYRNHTPGNQLSQKKMMEVKPTPLRKRKMGPKGTLTNWLTSVLNSLDSDSPHWCPATDAGYSFRAQMDNTLLWIY